MGRKNQILWEIGVLCAINSGILCLAVVFAAIAGKLHWQQGGLLLLMSAFLAVKAKHYLHN